MKNALLAFAFILIAYTLALAYSSGPPDGYAFQANNCTQCHNSYPLNSGNGSLQVVGVPISQGFYEPNQLYQLSVVLEDPGQSRWGFELTAYSEINSNLQMGTFSLISGVNSVQISDNPGTMWDYVKQTSFGTYSGEPNGPVSWPFMWTAPTSGSGTVVFSVAGNAANRNNSTSGDYIYYRSFSVNEFVNSIQLKPLIVESYQMITAYPNPFNPRTTLQVRVPFSGLADVALYNLNGQLVRSLYRGYLSNQAHTISFDASDLSSGTYIARLQGNGYTEDLKLVLTK